MVAPLIPERVVELVEAVRVSAVHGERALEWKRALDLSRRPRRAQVARQLIGFSNRMPEDAARWFGGQACLLIGIEPGKVSGMPNADPAVIDERLRPYTGGALRFSAQHVLAADGVVLALIVDRPRQRDRPYRLVTKRVVVECCKASH